MEEDIRYYRVSQFTDNQDWGIRDYEIRDIAGLIYEVKEDDNPSWGGAVWKVNFTTHEINVHRENYDSSD